VHDAPADDLEVAFSGTGAEMPNALGLSGGLPGAAIRVARYRGTTIPALLAAGRPLPAWVSEIDGNAETMPQKHPRTRFVTGEAWYHHWQGGAGYGDPLDRDPDLVARDVARHLVSVEAGRALYGVVLEHGSVNADATAREREAIRERRRRGLAPEAYVDRRDVAPLGSGWRIGEHVEIIRSARLTRCRRCGHGLAVDGNDHTRGCRYERASLPAAGPNRGEAYDRGRFRLELFYCPGCVTLLECEVVCDGAPRASYALSLDGDGKETR
jgi:N-methylhydantoinase B